MKYLIASSIQLAGIRAAGVLLQAVVFVFLARTLAPPDMGVFATVYAILGLMRFLGPLGSDQVTLRRIAGEAGGAVCDQTRTLSKAALLLTLMVGIFASGLTAALLSTPQLSPREVLFLCLSIPAFSLMGAFIGILRGFGHNLLAQTPEALGVHLVFALLIGSAAMLDQVSRSNVLLCLCITAWTVIAMYVVILTLTKTTWIEGNCFAPPRYLLALTKDGWPTFLALALTALSVRAPVLLSAALSGPTGAAIMDMAVRFGSVATMTTASVGATFSPRFAQLAHQGDDPGLMKALGVSALLALVPAAIWLILVSLAAHHAVRLLLPSAYEVAAVPMTLVALAYAINAALGTSTNLLFMSGRADIVSWLSHASLVVIVLGAVLLSPLWGIVGTAASLAVGLFIRDGGSMVFLLRKHAWSR